MIWSPTAIVARNNSEGHYLGKDGNCNLALAILSFDLFCTLRHTKCSRPMRMDFALVNM